MLLKHKAFPHGVVFNTISLPIFKK